MRLSLLEPLDGVVAIDECFRIVGSVEAVSCAVVESVCLDHRSDRETYVS